MKFAGVYKEKTEEEKKFYLRLITGARGVVLVVACDEKGQELARGNLMEISLAGVERVPGVDENLGFDLDDASRIKEI